MRHLVWLVVFAACGSKSPPSTTSTTSTSTSTTEKPARNPSACPASFATAKGLCDGTANCNYAEGSCYCGEMPVCSGVERPPDPAVWVCKKTPPAFRPDGCPGVQPDEGTACEGTRECRYGDCGGVLMGCVDGKWKTVRIFAPPP